MALSDGGEVNTDVVFNWLGLFLCLLVILAGAIKLTDLWCGKPANHRPAKEHLTDGYGCQYEILSKGEDGVLYVSKKETSTHYAEHSAAGWSDIAKRFPSHREEALARIEAAKEPK